MGFMEVAKDKISAKDVEFLTKFGIKAIEPSTDNYYYRINRQCIERTGGLASRWKLRVFNVNPTIMYTGEEDSEETVNIYLATNYFKKITNEELDNDCKGILEEVKSTYMSEYSDSESSFSEDYLTILITPFDLFEDSPKLNISGEGEHRRYFGKKIIIYSMDDSLHKEEAYNLWLDSSQTTIIDEKEFIQDWLDAMTIEIRNKRESKSKEIKRLREELIKEQSSIGHLSFMIKLINENNFVITDTLNNIRSIPGVKSVSCKPLTLIVKTEDIFIKNKYIGEFEFKYNFKTNRTFMRNLHAPSKDFQHIHSDYHGKGACTGGYHALLGSCLENFDYYNFFITVMEWLRTLTESDEEAMKRFNSLKKSKPKEGNLLDWAIVY